MLSFGHAVYYGLGGFIVVHAMNVITRNSLPIPLPLMPLVGGFAGLFFGIVFGSVSTRRGGTAFAMISLGLGELVASSALDPALLLRRRGRNQHQPHQAPAHLRLELRPANPGLLPDCDLVLHLRHCDVRAHPHAVRADVQRGARQFRARRVRRLQSAVRSFHCVFSGGLLRRHRRRACRDQLRDRQFELRRRGRNRARCCSRPISAASASSRPDHRRDPRQLAAGHAQRHHRDLAALFRPAVRRHGRVRAVRNFGPVDDARAALARARAVAGGARLSVGARRRPRDAHGRELVDRDGLPPFDQSRRKGR